MSEQRTLLERERELGVLANVIAEAREGRGQLVLVRAPAGLGKTTLLNAAAQTAGGAGVLCLRARASELEGDFAYGCVRQLLEPIVVQQSGSGDLFDGAAALAKPLFEPTRVARRPASADSAFSMLHGLYWLLNNLVAGGPALLSVDDLHWSDAESLQFLSYLAPRLDGLPLTVLASVRIGEGDTAELARLAAAPETTVLALKPLSLEATAALCEDRLGRDVAVEFAAACREVTGGNPFLLGALLREASEQRLSADAREAPRVKRMGPAAVAQSVLLRLSGTPPSATALVRALAVLGDGARLGELARLAEVEEDDAARAGDLLARVGILKPIEGFDFAHPIVREAVYGDIGPRARGETHARAAEVLSASGASEERIAAQLSEAPPAGDAERVELLRRVAALALVRGAPTAAVAYLRRALAESPSPADAGEVQLELGSAELRLVMPEAADHLAAAVELLQEPARRATAVRELANALTRSGDSDRAVEVIESAIEVVEPHDRELALLLELPSMPSWPTSRPALPRRGGCSDSAASKGRPPASAWSWRALPSSAPGQASRQAKPRPTSSARSRAAGCWASRSTTSPGLSTCLSSDCSTRTRSIWPTRAWSRCSPTPRPGPRSRHRRL